MYLTMELARRVTEPEEVEESLEVKTDTPSSEVKEHLSLSKFFDLDDRNISEKNEEYLKTIYEWAKSDTEAEMFNKLVTKRAELGIPRLGESRIFQIYTWVKLSKEYQLAKENLLKYEGAEK